MKFKFFYALVMFALLFQGCELKEKLKEKLMDKCDQQAKFEDNRSAVVPIDTNIDFNLEPGILYFADPRTEEGGLNRVIRLNYQAMDFTELAVAGINPHSIDRAGKTDNFYVRTQNSYSYDIINFKTSSVETVELEDTQRGVLPHKPRAIGGYNDKYKLQLLSGKDMPTVDVIDTTTGKVIVTVGDQNNSYSLGTNAGEDGTGHAFWLDVDHFANIDRVSHLLRVYNVSKVNNTLQFQHTQDFDTVYPVHAVERIHDAKNLADSLTFYAMVDGKVDEGIAPSVLELTFDDLNKQIVKGREVVFSQSIQTVNTIKPTTHHAALSADQNYLIVPILDGKVYIIDRHTMQIEKIVNAKLGAAHVNVSKSQNAIVITNHFDEHVTILDGTSFEVLKHIKISDESFDPNHKHLMQPHFSYIGPKGRYYYTFASHDGMFIKIDLRTLEVVEELFTDGAPEQSHS